MPTQRWTMKPAPQAFRWCGARAAPTASGSDAFANFDDVRPRREFDDAAGDRVADFVLGDVLVDAGGDQAASC